MTGTKYFQKKNIEYMEYKAVFWFILDEIKWASQIEHYFSRMAEIV